MKDSNPKFKLHVRDVFHFKDGRTALAGFVEGGEDVMILAGECSLLLDDRQIATIRIQPEMLNTTGSIWNRRDLRGVTTSDPVNISDVDLKSGKIVLEGTMTVQRHRHLIGIDFTSGKFFTRPHDLRPPTPEGWDGDAWVAPGERDYFLRAWSKITGQYAIARADRYEEARKQLLDEILHRPRKVVFQVTETVAKSP